MVAGQPQPQVADGTAQPHNRFADWMRRRNLMPSKRKRHVQWVGMGFRLRTLTFTACVAFICTFVLVSFAMGTSNGQWLLSNAKWVMSWTFVPIASLFEASSSTKVVTLGKGLEKFVGVDGVAIFLSTFVLSVIATVVITIVIGIIRTMRHASEDGNVVLLRGYEQQYEMGRMLR